MLIFPGVASFCIGEVEEWTTFFGDLRRPGSRHDF